MLDAGEVLLMCQLDVLDRHIVLLIDPGPALAMRHMPKRGDGNWRVFGLRQNIGRLLTHCLGDLARGLGA